MGELVSEDVGLGKIPRRAETILQLAEEPEIEVDLVVGGTVERTGGRLREAARRVDRVAEQHRLGPIVAAAEQLLPRTLGIVHDGVDHVDETLFVRRRRDLARRPYRATG